MPAPASRFPPFRPPVALTVAVIAVLVGPCALAQEVKVNPGDTLWGLARRHNTTVADLIELNDLTTTRLTPGMALTLPTDSTVDADTYTVRAGDTLYDIALATRLSVDDLIAINNLDGSVIRPGQELQLVETATPPEPLTVTVAPGDSLWALARTYDTTSAAIAAANGLSLSATIRPGNQLVIPGRYAGTSADQGGPVASTLVVERGDSLWAIARRYDTSVAALMSANGLSDERVRIGQTLTIVPGNELVRAEAAESGPVPDTASGMIWPVSGQITSKFGYRRLRIGGSNMHYGLDIDGHTGDPIRAATAGVVTHSGWLGGYGNLVIITAGNTEYYYAHASELAVSVGETVAVGQVIARVGNTGRSTGSHLHFEVRVDGTPVDPLPILERQASR